MASVTVNDNGRLLLFQKLKPGAKYVLSPVKKTVNGQKMTVYDLQELNETPAQDRSACWHCQEAVVDDAGHECPHYNS